MGKKKNVVKCANPNCENFSKKAKSYCHEYCADLANNGAFKKVCEYLNDSGLCMKTDTDYDCIHILVENGRCGSPNSSYISDSSNKTDEEKVEKKKLKKRNIEQTVNLLETIFLKVADYSEGGCGVCTIKREDMLLIVGRKKLKESRIAEIQLVLEETKGLLLIDEDSRFYVMDMCALPKPYPVTSDIIIDAMAQI
jgi:hypothetical protein